MSRLDKAFHGLRGLLAQALAAGGLHAGEVGPHAEGLALTGDHQGAHAAVGRQGGQFAAQALLQGLGQRVQALGDVELEHGHVAVALLQQQVLGVGHGKPQARVRSLLSRPITPPGMANMMAISTTP